MKDVFIIADNIISPLGYTSAENFERLQQGQTGIREHADPMSPQPFYAALLDKNKPLMPGGNANGYTKFEQMLIASVDDALQRSGLDATGKETVLIVSSTKGNISLLETEAGQEDIAARIALSASAKKLAAHFNFTNTPVIVSNACISGLLAIITAARLIRSGQYKHAVVTGADVISKFVLSGFQSFQAVSNEVCKPFDAQRKGINLGEAAGTVVLSADKKSETDIKFAGGSVSNDANHISGPSRTGEELGFAIDKAMKAAGLSSSDIDYVSAHGTATLYNDEMESKALTLAGLQEVPVNSLKAFYGHTLGAAGLIESIITLHSMKSNLILPSAGYNEPGVSQPLNICTKLQPAVLNHCLKTASGFGGCNAAIVFSK